MQTININGTDYKVKFSFRAIKNFEELTNKPITQCLTTWDNITFFFAALKAVNPEFTLTFDAFVDYIDEHPEILIQFQTADILANPESNIQNQASKKKHSPKTIFGLWTLFLLLSVSPVLVPVIFTIAWILTSFWLLATLTKTVGSKRA